MAKIWVEVCLISARGLRRASSLWKSQWFAVGWIEPNNKYCSKIDGSGNANPSWKTKFAALLDDSQFQDAALHVEVYSREPIFLREKLHGTATVVLKEFLAKHNKGDGVSRPATEEFGSFQLRSKHSSKTQGFIDISIRISEEKEELLSYPGKDEGIVLMDTSAEERSRHPSSQPPRDHLPFGPALPYPATYSTPSLTYPSASGPSYPPPRTPPPPPPPSHAGYVPTFLPNSDYMKMPSSSGGPPKPGLAMGLGAGALAAGAVIFGDDFMSGFSIPSSLQEPSITISTNPPL